MIFISYVQFSAFYYYQDEVAIVPLDRSRLHYVTDDVQALWGVNFAVGKGTVISYGPWADAQRRLLYKFFYPDDYQVFVAFFFI